MVSLREFRGDLYYRLNVFPVALPPLRERRQDIPKLVWHCVEICTRRMGKRIERISEETLRALTSYSWPGNVRELQNVIERAVILSNDGVLPNPLPTFQQNAMTPFPAQRTFRDSQRALILQALEATAWVIGGPGGAAARLALKRTTLIAKMKKLGISRPTRPSDDANQLSDKLQNEQSYERVSR
jgi:transcriptional regulator with GAF, ATPase, and Fis domain